MKHIIRWITLFLVVVVLAIPSSARADVAPPSHPPGFNPGPGVEATQVRMMAETVVITIIPYNDTDSLGQAKVTADFTMRNLGSTPETLNVRFPISMNNGFGEYPELKDLGVKVDGRTVTTRRTLESDPMWGSDLVPWAEFSVTFPVGQDVPIQVSYLLDGTGEYPFAAYYYILHTGAGWNDTIGSADIVARFPYEVNRYNVIFDEQIGWSQTTAGGVISGMEIKWHYENLEPEQSNDFELSIINPAIWRSILNEQSNLQANPNDGESWGRLGKAYKDIQFYRRGFRTDPGGVELYPMSRDAYEKALTLKPDDALWHAGFADLLAVHEYYENFGNPNVSPDTLRAMQEIHRALELAPNDPKVKEIAEKIYYLFMNGVQQTDSGYDFLWLTATPTFVSAQDEPTPVEATMTPPATLPPPSTATVVPTKEVQSTPTATPSARNPLCGSAALAPLALVWLARRKFFSRQGKPLL